MRKENGTYHKVAEFKSESISQQNNEAPLTSLSGLPKGNGEFCHIERIFRESGMFSFCGKEKIETADDVAYIFKELENASVENAFVVLVKENIPTIVHLGMGLFAETQVNLAAIKAAYDALGADQVYFVHNHPSGNLHCSRPDVRLLDVIAEMVGNNVLREGIIINTTSGKYGTFDLKGNSEETNYPQPIYDEYPLKLYSFDKTVFSRDYDPQKLSVVHSSRDIAALISSQRLGNRQKVSYLILDHGDHIVGNLHTAFNAVSGNETKIANEIVQNTIRFGGVRAVLYGSYSLQNVNLDFLNMEVGRFSGHTVKLLDCIVADGLHTQSAIELSLMEPTVEYKRESLQNDTNIYEMDDIRFRIADNNFSSFAIKYNLEETDVKQYADSMRIGNLGGASYALINMKRKVRIDNINDSFEQFSNRLSPIKKELYENFGNIDELREEVVHNTKAEHDQMEAARIRMEKEAKVERERLQEFQDMSSGQLDEEYFTAVNDNNESRIRDLVNEAARRNGYEDVTSDYQGMGAWTAPANPGYENTQARRADVEENSPDVNVEDIAMGYSPQPDDYFTNLRAYGTDTPEGKESAKVISNAINEIHNTGNIPKIKVYRAVPITVKENSIRNGDWVTLSKKYAEMHGNARLEGKFLLIEQEVSANELWWDGNDINEWGVDDGKGYRYKNTKNNRKLDYSITYDNKGNIIPLSQRFNSRKNDIRYRFIGEKGAAKLDRAEEATYRLDNLFVAKEMEFVGKDALSIKIATGWERGANDKWRYEDDAFGGEHNRMSNDAYKNIAERCPEIEEWIKSIDDIPLEKRGDLLGFKLSDIAERILSHEVQHAIQHIEGFAHGGNLSVAEGKYIDVIRAQRELSGEVEARNVQSRMGMSLEERRNSLAKLTEDTRREDQIFLRNAFSASMHPSRAEFISAVESLANSMHTSVNIINDINELPDSLIKKKIESGSNVKGWFIPTTNSVNVYLPHISSLEDAQRTVFHEAVAHYGLRKMFGEHFDVFLDNVYNNAVPEIQGRILYATNGDPTKRLIETEEYLAKLAERGFSDPDELALWKKIKSLFIDMLKKSGVDLNFKLTDNSLRYILYKSYQNLTIEVSSNNLKSLNMDEKINETTQATGTTTIPNEIKGVVLTEQQKEQLSKGEQVFLENLIDRNGKPFSANVSYDLEKNKPVYSFQENIENGTQQEFRMPNAVKGIVLSEENKQKLALGEKILVEGMTSAKGTPFDAYVYIDQEKKTLAFDFPEKREQVQEFRMPNAVKGIVLSEENKQKLVQGEKILVEGMTSAKGTPFDAYVYIDQEKKTLAFDFPEKNEQAQEFRMPNAVKGIVLSEENKQRLTQGEKILVEGMTSAKGTPFNAYVYIDQEKKTLAFDFPEKNEQAQEFRMPNTVKGIILSEENKQRLTQGEKILVEGMTSAKGTPFDAYVYIDQEKKTLAFDFPEKKEKKKESIDSPQAEAIEKPKKKKLGL
ncbi:DUF3945 domain-containing protein [Bacteroides sp. CG01]|uniref:DUF3945 domain-containing protein n=1 Tax=Bacteroides sp. CG01 TaxID=3096000 RepID=UPI002AFFE9F6|nr:DUF3945 domain-containing protein [Bacteroides sp. CG01]